MAKVIGGMTISQIGFASDAQGNVGRLYPELHLGIMPVLLGGGLRLFEGVDATRFALEKIRLFESGPRTDIWFRVVK